jgi:hypothetical protein
MNMVIVVLKASYPPHKAEEIMKIVPELAKKYQPDESIAEAVVRGAGRSTDIGYEGMTIWKVKEGQFDKLITRIMGAMSMYSNVEGYRWSIETWATAEEMAASGLPA